jgi:hypothetical protein
MRHEYDATTCVSRRVYKVDRPTDPRLSRTRNTVVVAFSATPVDPYNVTTGCCPSIPREG